MDDHNHTKCCTHCSHSHNNENKSITFIRIFLSAILFISGYFISNNLSFVIFLTAYAICGYDVIYRAIKNIFKGKIFDENFLMGLATIGAIGIKEYPEAVMVMILYQIGESFQDYAVEKSRKSISELMNIRPDYANIEKDGKLIKVNPTKVAIGSIITVTTGEKIPIDGTVISGKAILDTSAITGESIPKKIEIGDNAISGCINLDGLLKIKTQKAFGEATVSKILKLVETAGEKKAKTEKFITKFAKYYTPIVVISALFLAFIPPILIKGTEFSDWISRALTFLVISCPCALVISVPLGFFAGIAGASKRGILIKGSSFIETLSKPDTIVFDKTGTLTKGIFKVTSIKPENISKEELLEICAYAENYSSHPISQSIKEAYGKSIDINKIQEVKEISGKGIIANIENKIVLIGNNKLLDEFNIKFNKIDTAETYVYTAINGVYAGYIIISDEIKEDAASAILELKKLARQIIMLSGDNKDSTENTAKRLGIDKNYSQLLPENKVEKLEEIINEKRDNKSVIFVGDGINDAPVLTRADAGIAMGALGSDAAIEAADIVIMDDKPSKIPEAVKISKKTLYIIKENIIFAIGIKILFLLLGALGFMTMWGAVFADVGVALIAITNSLRALRI